MFGIMKPQSACSKQLNPSYNHHRQHYCGTCKAIGQAYGQHSRLLLNFDGVFLAELLTQLSNQMVPHWEPRLQTPNTCLTMPVEAVPFALRYAAAATLLFSHLSIDDQITDNNQLRWRWTKRLFNNAFSKAVTDLQQWEVDTDFIQAQAAHQVHLEAQALSNQPLEQVLDYYSQPTQAITAHVFEQSVRDASQRPIMAQLGQAFGQLLYILDAFEDYEQDVFKGTFNPLAQYWGTPRQLQTPQLDQVRQHLLQCCQQVQQTLALLPLEADFLHLQQSRLESNLMLRLYQERLVPQTWQERLQQRYQNAQDLAARWLCNTQSPLYRLQYYLVVLAVFVSPQTKGYLPQDGKIETFGWMTFATAVLAGLGWIRAKRYGPPISKKKKKKRRRRRKHHKPNQQNDCGDDCGDDCGECCGQCLTECFAICFATCITAMCRGLCDAINDSEQPGLMYLLLFGSLVLIAGVVVLLVVLL